MSYGRALLLSVFLITIVSSINFVDARRSPAAKKKTPELFLDSDQDFGIEVRINDYGAGLGGPLAAASYRPRKPAEKKAVKAYMDARREAGFATSVSGNYPKIGGSIHLPSPFVETINDQLKEIPEDDKELLKKIGKIDGLELTYDKTIGKFRYVIDTKGKTSAQIKETIRLVNEVLNTP